MESNVSLRRNWRFQALWIGAAAGFAGVQITTIAYPLLILSVTGSAALAGVFSAVQLSATLIFGIPAGSVVDRRDRRHVLILGEVARLLGAASVALAVMLHHLNYPLLLVVAAITGAIQPFTGSARMLATRAVVPADQLTQALAQEQVRDYATQLLGPSIGGTLFSMGRALPFLANAIGFLISLASAVAVRFESPQGPNATNRVDKAPDSAPLAKSRPRGELFAGLVILWRSKLLRTVLVSIMAVNLIVNPLDLVTIVLARHDGVPSQFVGMIFAGFALGGLLGAPFTSRINAVLEPGQLLLVVLTVFSIAVAAMALPLGALWLAGCLTVAGFGVPAVLVLLDILIFRRVTDEKRGRVIAATTTLMVAGQPLGSAAGGLLLQYLSPATTVVIMAFGLALTVTLIIRNRELRSATWQV